MTEEIAKDLIKNIQILLKNYRSLLNKEEYIKIKKIEFDLIHNSLSLELEDINKQLRPFFGRVWDHELTNFDDFQVGGNFKFVITVPTVDSSFYDKSNKDIISSSLITNKHMGTFNRKNYGLVCNVDASNFLISSSFDIHGVCPKENDYPGYIHLATTADGHKVFGKKAFNTLKLPTEIEMELIKQNIKENGDFILEDYKNIYSDITLDAKSTNFLGVILFEPYNEYEQKEAEALAQKYNVELKIIPKKLYYNKLSLASEKENKHYYDLTNIDTILFIAEHVEDISHEFSNLIIENTYSIINIKEETNKEKISINKNLNIINIYITNDMDYFKIDFSMGKDSLVFILNDELITKNEFQEELIKKKEINMSR